MPVAVRSVAGKLVPSDSLTAALGDDPGTRDASASTVDSVLSRTIANTTQPHLNTDGSPFEQECAKVGRIQCVLSS